jgi:hypothetical protein
MLLRALGPHKVHVLILCSLPWHRKDPFSLGLWILQSTALAGFEIGGDAVPTHGVEPCHSWLSLGVTSKSSSLRAGPHIFPPIPSFLLFRVRSPQSTRYFLLHAGRTRIQNHSPILSVSVRLNRRGPVLHFPLDLSENN